MPPGQGRLRIRGVEKVAFRFSRASELECQLVRPPRQLLPSQIDRDAWILSCEGELQLVADDFQLSVFSSANPLLVAGRGAGS